MNEYKPDGTLVQTLTTADPGPVGSTFDASGNFYVTSFRSGAVDKFDVNGNLAGTFGSGYGANPESILFDQSGNAYVGHASRGLVLKFDPAGNPLATFNPTIESRGADWIELASDQCTLFYTSEGHSVKRFNVCTNTQLADFATGLLGNNAYALRRTPSGDFLVADTDRVVRLNSSGAVIQTYTKSGDSLLFALTLDPDGTSFWTGDAISADIIRFDISTGNVIKSFTAPSGIAGISIRSASTFQIYRMPINANTAAPFSGPVAYFADPAPAPLSAYTASINWGDGNTSAGTITNPGGATIQGSHGYTKPGNYSVTVTVSKAGGGTASVSANARVVTHYQVEARAWIPQQLVVDPFIPFDWTPYLPASIEGNCYVSPNPLSTFVTSRYAGDNHQGYVGNYRAHTTLDFDWDGSTIQNQVETKADGVTRRFKQYYDASDNIVRYCRDEATAPSTDLHAYSAGGSSFRLNIGGISGKNPLVPAVFAPSIENNVVGLVKPDGTVNLGYDTTSFPDLGIQVTQNGVAVSSIVNNVSCLAASDVVGLGGFRLLTLGLNRHSNRGEWNYGTSPSIDVPSSICNSKGLTGLFASSSVSMPAGTTGSPPAQPRARQAAATGAITGLVTDSSNAALANICVAPTTTLDSRPVIPAVRTATNGTYTLVGLAGGNYDVHFYECAQGGAHISQWFNNQTVQSTAIPVVVTAGGTTSGVNARLSVGATISGTITNGSSSLVGVCAHADDGLGHTADSQPSSSTGTYTVGGLPAATYAVAFTDCSGGDFLTQFYNGAASSATSTAISVGSSGNTPGINASMVKGGAIGGTVSGVGGTAPGICTVATTLTSGRTAAFAGPTDSTGSYALHGLAAGTYAVRFSECGGGNHSDQFWNGKPLTGTPDPVTVTLGTISGGINATLADGGTVTGTILDSSSRPIQGACATASGGGGAVVATSPPTTSSGAYTIQGLPTGTYSIQLFDCSSGNHIARSLPSPVSVTAGSTTTGVGGQLATGGVIGGTTTPTVGGSPVCANLYDLNQNLVGVSPADGSGNYTLSGLPTGDYKVDFVDCPAGHNFSTWYSGKPDFGSATTVHVQAGSTTSGVNQSLGAAGAISGRLTDASSSPLAGICVQSRSAVSGALNQTLTDQNGNYAISGLAPGSYVIHFASCPPVGGNFISQWFNAQPTAATATPVSVSAGNTTGSINGTMAAGGAISGVVTDVASAPLGGVCVTVRPTGSSTDAAVGSATASNGQYTIAGLPSGSYVVEFVDCSAGTHFPQFYNGQPTAATAQLVQVTAPATASGINATLALGGTISGTVTSASTATPVSGECVDIFAVGASAPTASAASATDGTYKTQPLAAGNYQLRFSDCRGQGYAMQWASGKPDQTSADSVALTAGNSTTGINAALTAVSAISIGDATVVRLPSGSGTASFPISLSAASLSPVSLNVATADGSAQASRGDYMPLGVTTITFAPGETSKAVVVGLFASAFPPSGSKTFSLVGSSPLNAPLARASGAAMMSGGNSSATVYTAVSTQRYQLSNNDGSTWVTMDPTNLVKSVTPTVDSTAILGGNVDLYTDHAGMNQDVAIFVSDNGGVDQLLAWKESGGAASFTPNGIFLQSVYSMTAGHTYTFKLKWKSTFAEGAGVNIFAAAGPAAPFSPTRLTAKVLPAGANPYTAVSTQRYQLSNNDGSTWVTMDATSLVKSVTPTVDSTAILGGNVDLYTDHGGMNQDVAIFVNDNGGADQLLAWKESGGGGSFAPNGVFVQSVYSMSAGHTYTFKLKWKSTFAEGAGVNIFAAAGPAAPFSPTRLTAEVLPAGANPYTAVSTQRYQLSNNDGSTWVTMDAANLVKNVTPTVDSAVILGGNVDLYTDHGGMNQDVAIFVSDNAGVDQLLAWKESGAPASFAPFGAFVQSVYSMTAGHTYTFKLKWKSTFAEGAGVNIFAAAGPAAPFSPTRLTAEIVSLAP